MIIKSTFAIIIPCFNEEKAIPLFLKEVESCLNDERWGQLIETIQFVFVDNASTDDSFHLLQNFALKMNAHESKKIQVQVIKCLARGYGAALKAGFKSIEADWYGFADLDNTYPLNMFYQMLETAQAHQLQIVFGNRLRLKTGMPFVRRIGNLFYSYLANFLFDQSVHDMCTGMRIFNKRCLPFILNLKSDGLHFSIEFTALALKLKWLKQEINIEYRERIGTSKLSVIKDGFQFLFILLKVKFLVKPFRTGNSQDQSGFTHEF